MVGPCSVFGEAGSTGEGAIPRSAAFAAAHARRTWPPCAIASVSRLLAAGSSSYSCVPPLAKGRPAKAGRIRAAGVTDMWVRWEDGPRVRVAGPVGLVEWMGNHMVKEPFGSGLLLPGGAPEGRGGA